MDFVASEVCRFIKWRRNTHLVCKSRRCGKSRTFCRTALHYKKHFKASSEVSVLASNGFLTCFFLQYIFSSTHQLRGLCIFYVIQNLCKFMTGAFFQGELHPFFVHLFFRQPSHALFSFFLSLFKFFHLSFL